jgi:hypothetical protein
MGWKHEIGLRSATLVPRNRCGRRNSILHFDKSIAFAARRACSCVIGHVKFLTPPVTVGGSSDVSDGQTMAQWHCIKP